MKKTGTPGRPGKKMLEKLRSQTTAHNNLTTAMSKLKPDEDDDEMTPVIVISSSKESADGLQYWSSKDGEELIADGAAALSLLDGPSGSGRKRTRSCSKSSFEIKLRAGEQLEVDEFIPILQKLLTLTEPEKAATSICRNADEWIISFPNPSPSPEGKKTREHLLLKFIE